MIQRIQTVYWLVSMVILGIMLFLPLFINEQGQFLTTDCEALTATIIATCILTGVNIFLYRNRLLQIRISYVLKFLHLLMYVFIWVHFRLDQGTQVLPWIGLPLVSWIFQFLAVRGVKKDEALIKSMDRLR